MLRSHTSVIGGNSNGEYFRQPGQLHCVAVRGSPAIIAAVGHCPLVLDS